MHGQDEMRTDVLEHCKLRDAAKEAGYAPPDYDNGELKQQIEDSTAAVHQHLIDRDVSDNGVFALFDGDAQWLIVFDEDEELPAIVYNDYVPAFNPPDIELELLNKVEATHSMLQMIENPPRYLVKQEMADGDFFLNDWTEFSYEVYKNFAVFNMAMYAHTREIKYTLWDNNDNDEENSIPREDEHFICDLDIADDVKKYVSALTRMAQSLRKGPYGAMRDAAEAIREKIDAAILEYEATAEDL